MSSNRIIITESQLKAIAENNIGQFNIRKVYHVSESVFDEFKIRDGFFPYIFFSSKPIQLYGSNILYTCNLSMHNPFVFEHAESWSYPLWLYLSDREGYLIPEEEFTKEKYDGYLGCPYEFWYAVYYDKDEWETDQIPYIVKELNMGYDGVIVKNVDEGDTSITVDDYIVFEPSQVQIVSVKDLRK